MLGNPLQRQRPTSTNIPYTCFLDPFLVGTKNGAAVQTIKLGGAAFQSADDDDLNTLKERLNVLWRTIASEQVALWTHTIRRRSTETLAGPRDGYAGALSRRYEEKMASTTLYVNELYLSLIYRPQTNAADRTILRLLRKSDATIHTQEIADAIDASEKLRGQVVASLGRYDPEPLAGADLLSVIGQLVNGGAVPMPLPRAPLDQALPSGMLFFGKEAIEYRGLYESRLGTMLGFREYPPGTAPDMLAGLLTAPFAFVLTQSFSFAPKHAAESALKRHYARMVNSGDTTAADHNDYEQTVSDLKRNELVVGEHHISLQVLSDPYSGTASDATHKRLNDDLAQARTLLANTGALIAREDMAAEAAFWAQLPGNFAMRPRVAGGITSRNFCDLAPFFNYPAGRRTGNHWGNATAMFATTAGSPYYFSLHASDPRAVDGGSRRDVGHTLILGPTGSGKTVVQGFLMTQLTKQDVTQILFDKDQGLAILVRAMGGTYLPLKIGQPTGFNPLQLPEGPGNLAFLRAWLRNRIPRPLTNAESNDLNQAIAAVLNQPVQQRRLSRIADFLNKTDPDGPHGHLAKWFGHGEYAWAFDNAHDTFLPILSGAPLVGFDITELLKEAPVRDAFMEYAFHVIGQRIGNGRTVVWCDEFAHLLSNDAFAAFAKDGLQTWRKLDACFVGALQSPSAVIESSIARSIIEQTATKIFFPNADATREDYVGGFSLSEREFALIKYEMLPGNRSFLVKQGRNSVVCTLDLKGFDFDLTVISGRAANIRLVEKLVAGGGDWLPEFERQIA